MRLKGRERQQLPLGRAIRRSLYCLSLECHLNLS